MSDTSNFLQQLVDLYNTLLDKIAVRGARAAELATANVNLADAQNAKSVAEAAVAQHQAQSDNFISQIQQLTSDMNVHNQGRSNLDAQVVNADNFINNKLNDVARAQESLGLAENEYNAVLQQVNDLKARIKAEVDDDFPT